MGGLSLLVRMIMCVTPFSLLPSLSTLLMRDRFIPSQNARILDAESGAVKVDLRDHDSVVESAVFVPPFAIDSIRQLVEFTVSDPLLLDSFTREIDWGTDG
jgi:hypothetical protein